MNVKLEHHQYPPKNPTLACFAWMVFAIALWTAGILLCEKIIEALYFR
jgi:hypothetical protein